MVTVFSLFCLLYTTLQDSEILLDINNKDENLNINEVKDYEHDNVSEKIVRTILSYTSYINREVWKK